MQKLQEQHTLRGLVRVTSNLKLLQGASVELLHGDVTDPASIAAAVAGVDLVIHTAGAVMDWGELEEFKKINVEGTRQLALAAEKAGVQRLVHISTVAVHGFDFQYATEEHPMPPSPVAYCETKKLAEQWLKEFARSSRMEIVMVRPGNVFGPHDEKFIQPYLDFIKKGGFLYVNGGRGLTCPSYIENLVHGIELACFQENIHGESFILTDGLEINWRQFTSAFVEQLGLPQPQRSLPWGLVHGVAYGMESVYKLLGKRDAPLLTRYRINNAGKDYHFSIEKARRLLGYQPPVDFETSVSRTIAWYRNQHPV
ncbi:MAG: NAD-dependent epimerase/dehydratase family protein [Saprospiraceae bacterium]|nr:NAD-dependent epimerase/dehydratase family protein [Saprospiraceae bacterium]